MQAILVIIGLVAFGFCIYGYLRLIEWITGGTDTW